MPNLGAIHWPQISIGKSRVPALSADDAHSPPAGVPRPSSARAGDHESNSTGSCRDNRSESECRPAFGNMNEAASRLTRTALSVKPKPASRRIRRTGDDGALLKTPLPPENLADHYGPLAHNQNARRPGQLETDGRRLRSGSRNRNTLDTGMWYKTSSERRKSVLNPFISIFCVLNHVESRFYRGLKTVTHSR